VKRVLLAATFPVLQACGGGDGGTGPNLQPLGIAGAWDLTVALANDANSCSFEGVVTFTESGERLSGNLDAAGVCVRQEGGNIGVAIRAPVTGTVQSATTFEWSARAADPSCRFEGSVSGSPAVAQSGTVECTTVGLNFPVGGFPAQGTWEASR
jgi:hypothetical protein